MLYWAIPGQKLSLRNTIVLLASYFFYGWWDWRLLGLIVVVSAVNFLGARLLQSGSHRISCRALLSVILSCDFGVLAVFKYANWFLESLEMASQTLGVPLGTLRLDVVLPVGISFYTFQAASYVLDVHAKRIQATKNVVAFFAYVAFFPQLVAGPIERANQLLPQFLKGRRFSLQSGADGLRLMLWGFFKKMVIADNCARHVDSIFASPETYSGSILMLGAALFAFQIYGDFSGYSDIARGAAKLFGIELMVNFRTPYFASNIAEFWKRWHISLSSWFMTYLYIPLGGSRGSLWLTIRNVLIVFAVSGVWHGADGTFLVWGLLNGLYFLPFMLLKRVRSQHGVACGVPWVLCLIKLGGIVSTFVVTCFAWIIFRAENLAHARVYFQNLLARDLFSVPNQHRAMVPIVVGFVIFEWICRHGDNPLGEVSRYRSVRWFAYAGVAIAILLFGSPQKNEFIYFQF